MPYTRMMPLFLFLLLSLFLASGLFMPDRATLTQPAIIGSMVPDFALQRVDEPGMVVARTWRKQLSVVNFFASWCVPCQAEHPVLMSLAQNPAIKLYGIAWKDQPANTSAYLTKFGNPFQMVASDPQGDLTVIYGIGGVPETLLVDQTGVVRWKYAGPLTNEVVQQQLLPMITRYAAP